MKLKLLLSVIALAVVAGVGAANVNAQDATSTATTTSPTATTTATTTQTTATSTTATTTATSTPSKKPGDRLKVQLGDNLEKNKEVRNIRKDGQGDVKDVRKDAQEAIKDVRNEYKSGSTTIDFKSARKTIQAKMKLDIFEVRKNTLVRELTTSLNFLNAARTRISDYITAHDTATTTGTTTVSVMADAKAALVIADDKLAKAKIALDAFKAFSYTGATTTAATSTTATTSVEVSLDKPRQIGDAAIKAIKEARNALKMVVVEVTQALRSGKK
jgi:hypothetical protein